MCSENKRGRKPRPVEDRFWSKVDKNGPIHDTQGQCWLFTSNHGGGDYGMLSVKSGEYLAHRISWIIHNGPIPEGLKVLHKCDVRKCVNPEHLFLGTSLDNMKDMVEKGRSRKGSNHPTSKLNEADVKKIRRLYVTGKYTQQAIADMYGVNQTGIGFIVRRVHWKHV